MRCFRDEIMMIDLAWWCVGGSFTPEDVTQVLYRFEDFRLDDAARTLHQAGSLVSIEPKAFDLLLHLVRNSTRVVSRQELLDSVWAGMKVSDTAINRCVKVARNAIADEDPDQRRISTVHGRGFRFLSSVSVADPSGTMWLDTAQIAGSSTPLEPPGGPFAGRVEELERVQLAWRDALGGCRRVVLIAGEPGIGKTRLAREAAAQTQGDGALVLLGRCDDELAVPFQPFLEVMDQFVRWCPRTSLRALLGRYAGELMHLLPQLGELIPGLESMPSPDVETQRFRLFLAVADWLNELSVNVPVVLILDDLHWATKETLLLLRYLLRSLPAARVLVLATYRDTDVSDSPWLADVLADVQREPGVQRLMLEGLDVDSVAKLLAAAGGYKAPPAGLAASIQAFGRGNALYVSEIIRSLNEQGLPMTGGEPLAIPSELRAIVQRRVRRLPESCRKSLAWACVIGEEIDQNLLRAVQEEAADIVADALEPACQARILEPLPSGNYRFVHRLVREALYTDLSLVQRSQHHRRIASSMENVLAPALDSHLGALAFHFAHAGDAFRQQAVDYSVRAAEHATWRLAHGQAAEHYATALQLLAGEPPTPLYEELRRRLAAAQNAAAIPAAPSQLPKRPRA